MEEEQKVENRNLINPEADKLRFWLLGTLTLLFLITFVYYLPLRFREQVAVSDDHLHDESGMMDMMHMHDDGSMHDHSEDAHAGHTLPGASEIERLPLKTPADRVDRLLFEEIQQYRIWKGKTDIVKEFRLEASEFRWEYAPGQWVHAWGYNGQVPGPEIRVTEGDRVRIIVKNNLPDATTVHWHGLDVPWQMDGVAGVTQQAIGPGEEFTYEFDALPAGTRFYHTHGKSHITSAQQMDMGLSGAFIVEPQEGDLVVDRDYTLILDEWDILAGGVNAAVAHVHGAGEEGAVPEFNTFTINGRVFPYTETLHIREGEFVRVRFINAGTAAFHPMHLHGHSFEVIAKDGFLIPRGQREVRNTITINPGETVDILVRGNNPGPWLLHCHHVHHAAAGMITLLQYEGHGPVGGAGELSSGGMPMMPEMHAHTDEGDEHEHLDDSFAAEDDHTHAPGTAPHTHGDTVQSSGSAWWGLLFVSLVLMTILGLGVNKYLRGTSNN